MKLKKLIFTTFTAVLLWSAAAHAEVTDTGTGSNAERNIKAIENYRTVLLNNTWNSKRIKAYEFATLDMNQDGVLEVFLHGYGDGNYHSSALIKYSNTGLEIYYPDSDEFNIEIFTAVNPYDGRIVTSRARGKEAHALYQFNGASLQECNIIRMMNVEDLELLNAAQTNYNNLFYLNFVDITQENIDTYLSGDGKETGIFEQWSILYDTGYYKNNILHNENYGYPTTYQFGGNNKQFKLMDHKLYVSGSYFTSCDSDHEYMNQTFDILHDTEFSYKDKTINFERFKDILTNDSNCELWYAITLENNNLRRVTIT